MTGYCRPMVDVVQVGADEFSVGVLDRIRAACAEVDHHDPIDEATALALKHRGIADAALWLAGDSGFALVRDGNLDLAVAPTVRRCGFGRGLLEVALAGTERAEAGPLAAWSHGDHPAAAHLAEAFGFARVRELWVLRRAGTLALPDLDAPGLRTFRPGDEAELLRVNAAAFAHHPEQGRMSAQDLAERMAEPWFDPEGLFLAVEGDRVLGFHWTKVHPSGSGEVYVVGIDPAAQGRGLGRTLTLAGLHHLAARGVPEVHLYVESDNAPALAVYTGLGFTHGPGDTHVRYRRA